MATEGLPGLVAPGYTDGFLGQLGPALLTTLTGADTDTDVPLLGWPRPPRSVILLVIDGLGRRLLDAHADHAPLLSTAAGPVLDAAFPTSTATNLTSLGTGLPPSIHGMTATALRGPGERTLHLLTWTWDRQGDGPDARRSVVPERFQPQPTVFDAARSAGLAAATVLRPEFVGSGLTRAALRGADVRTAEDLDEVLAAALTAARARPGLVYAHHGDLDAAGHRDGPGSDAWCAELARIDAKLASFQARLPRDVGVVVTADHGMVGVRDADRVELSDHPELLDGVRLLAGEPRVRQLAVRPGALDDVLTAWREHQGGRGEVRSADEALAAGWFGPPGRSDPTARARLGDVIVAATGTGAWVHRDLDPRGGRQPGQHGSLSDDERRVPALLLMA